MAKSILVLGAGVIGLSTAYYAARKGLRVTVVDRKPRLRDGCSFGNAGMVVPSHFTPLAAPGMVALGLKWMWNPESPFYIKPRLDAGLLGWGVKFWRAANSDHVRNSAPLLRDLSLASRACFEEIAALTDNDFGLVNRGLLMLCKTSHVLEEESKTAAIARTLGLPADVLDARQTAALDPNIQMDVAGSVYFPKDCHLSPDRFMRTLEAISFDLGVRFVWESGVVGWRTTGQRIDCVQTSSGEFSADEYVLAAGAWSDVLGRDLGLSIPIQSGKGYSLTLSTPPQLPQICAILTEARVAVTPMGAALRVGGTMEISGLDETISGRRVQGIIKAVSQYYPAFNKEHFAGVQPWAGLRPCSPDGLPYVGRTRRYTNLCVATGHAMMGLSLGPITGKLVSEILSEVSPSIPINLLDPDRYL